MIASSDEAVSGKSIQMSHDGKHENGMCSQAVFNVSCLTIVTQRETRSPISTDTVSGVRCDGITCVDNASLQMCSAYK
jgi:hypothetical protein